VGLISAAVTFSFALLSFVGWVQGGDLFFSMVVMLVFTLFYGLTALRESRIGQSVQVFTYLISGFLVFADSGAPTAGGYLFVVFAIFLFNEYTESPKRILVMVVIGLTTVLLDIGLRLRTLQFLSLQAIQTTIFATAVLLLFNILSYRQIAIRRLHVEELESRIAARTADLQTRTEELSVAVDQRDVLVKEVHHRVGNSLQVLASYISLCRGSGSLNADQVLDATLLRMRAIAEVYRLLHNSNELEEVSLDDYIARLISDVCSVFVGTLFVSPPPRTDLRASIDFVVPFGLVMQELLANCAKHGLGARKMVHAEARVALMGDQVCLVVADDGPGFSLGWTRTIGTEITDELVSQLGGEIERGSENGARVTCRFPASCLLVGKVLSRAGCFDVSDSVSPE